ncbi:MAG: hypothetical protein Q9169_002750 [Polycauliona sp. 2 TL-2023]
MRPPSSSILLASLIPFTTAVSITLTHEVTLLPPYGNGDIVLTCTNIAPGVCCEGPRGTGADNVRIQHLTIFDVAALWQSRRSPTGQILTECSGRIVDSRPGPADWRWHRRREGMAYDSPSVHGASYITMPRSLPPDGNAKAWMAVEGLLGLAWGTGEWFVNEKVRSGIIGGRGGGGFRSVKRDLRLEKQGKVYSRPPLRAVYPDLLEIDGQRFTGNDGVMYTDGNGNSINVTEVLGSKTT